MSVECRLGSDISNNEFLFTWEIENFQLLDKRKDKYIKSPEFVADTLHFTKWCFKMLPNNFGSQQMGLYIYRRDGSPASIIINCECSIILDNELLERCSFTEQVFNNCQDRYGLPNIIHLEKILTKGSGYLDKITVTIECRLWMDQIENTNDGVIEDIKPKSNDNVSGKTNHKDGKNTKTTPFVSTGQLKSPYYKKVYKLCSEYTSTSHICTPMSNQYKLRTRVQAAHTEFKMALTNMHNLTQKLFTFSVVLEGKPSALLLHLDERNGINAHVILDDDFKYVSLHKKIVVSNIKGLPVAIFISECYSRELVTVLHDVNEIECQDSVSFHIEVFAVKNIITECVTVSSFRIPKRSKRITPQEGHLSQMMQRLFVSHIFCDVTLKVGEHDIPAHKAILAANSPILEARLLTQGTSVLEIDDVEEITMKRMLRFMYTEDLGDTDVTECMELYSAGYIFQYEHLKRKCGQFLLCNLTIDNVCDVLLLFDDHGDSTRKKAAVAFVAQNKTKVISSLDWRRTVEIRPAMATDIILTITSKMQEDIEVPPRRVSYPEILAHFQAFTRTWFIPACVLVMAFIIMLFCGNKISFS